MEQVQPIEQGKLKIVKVTNSYARTTYAVVIPPAIRRNFTDQQIVNMVDAGGDVRQAYAQNNFGGWVSEWPGADLYRVVVFTD